MGIIDEILSRCYPLNKAEVEAIKAVKTAEIIAENDTLRERIRTLEAGIEPLRQKLSSGNTVPVSRVVLDEQDCARLRALLQDK